jgi:cell division protein FtsB
MTDKNVAEVSKYFKCDNCDYFTSKKSNYNKHLLTSKHKYLQNTDKNVAKVAIKFDCICGKSYKHRQSLYTHQSKCMFKDKESIIELKEDNKELKEDNKELKEDNKELKNMIKELIKENTKQQTQISELIPKLCVNNTINNTQNNKFNINVFLNEQCKNAINLSDFIKSLHITLEQLDFTKQNGLAQGLSKSIIDNMNKLSIYERPMHCTDTKRETLYIKDDDNWSKNGAKEKLKTVIKKTSSKNFNALMDWKNLNPDYMNNEDKTDYFTKTISTIGKSTSTIDDKIIKSLCKETYVK